MEPLLTIAITLGATRLRGRRWLAACIDEGTLQRIAAPASQAIAA